MNATTYHALSEGLRELDRSLTAARYGQGRHGTVPPEEIATTVEEVAAEAASLRRFLRASEKEAAA